jgi:hypothetical protein
MPTKRDMRADVARQMRTMFVLFVGGTSLLNEATWPEYSRKNVKKQDWYSRTRDNERPTSSARGLTGPKFASSAENELPNKGPDNHFIGTSVLAKTHQNEFNGDHACYG